MQTRLAQSPTRSCVTTRGGSLSSRSRDEKPRVEWGTLPPERRHHENTPTPAHCKNSPVLHPRTSHRTTTTAAAALTGLRSRLLCRSPAEEAPREPSQAGWRSRAFRPQRILEPFQGSLLSPFLPREVDGHGKEQHHGRQSC